MTSPASPRRIAIIGNVAGGKTHLARRLSQQLQLPVLHIDSVQFLPGLKIRPLDETRKVLKTFCEQDTWIVDGYGPLDLLEPRMKKADLIVLIDLPVWRHYFWCLRRQLISVWSPRKELPSGCSELSWQHTRKLFKTIREMHTKMRPELLRILSRDTYRDKTIILSDVRQLQNYSLPLK